MLKRYYIFGTIFVITLGTLAHFFYDWSGHNTIVGLFTPVNESTLEHMKLVFFPMLLISIFIIKKMQGDYPCIGLALLSGTLLGTILIPVIFYTYTGILGQNYLVLDIATFVLSVVIAFYSAFRLTLSCKLEKYYLQIVILVYLAIICFFVFTYYPFPSNQF